MRRSEKLGGEVYQQAGEWSLMLGLTLDALAAGAPNDALLCRSLADLDALASRIKRGVRATRAKLPTAVALRSYPGTRP